MDFTWILSVRVSLDRMNLEQVRRHTSLSNKWNIDKAHNFTNFRQQSFEKPTSPKRVFTQTVPQLAHQVSRVPQCQCSIQYGIFSQSQFSERGAEELQCANSTNEMKF